jgi:hypothetical protein
MPSGPTTFATAVRVAGEDPRAFHEYRRAVIAQAIARRPAGESLQHFQNHIDALRATEASPRRSLRAIMAMLDGHLSTLGEALAHWQCVLARQAGPEQAIPQAALAQISAMIAATESLRRDVAGAGEHRSPS